MTLFEVLAVSEIQAKYDLPDEVASDIRNTLVTVSIFSIMWGEFLFLLMGIVSGVLVPTGVL